MSYSGLLPLASTANKSALFFWFFEANENPETAPVVLWLNGGPGTVSTLGLFYEMGPYRINSDLSLTTNPYAWTKKVNMVFLDQPIGVGFSVHDPDVPLPTNETMVANAVYEALLEFFRLFPEYQQRPFYVTGTVHENTVACLALTQSLAQGRVMEATSCPLSPMPF